MENLKDTAELPLVDDTMPATPRPRPVPEDTAHPAWIAAMDGLRRAFCEEDHGPLCFCVDCLSRAEEREVP
jgi:hypothetical protein